jgi:apolipoprotein D and lipocalin family protein
MKAKAPLAAMLIATLAGCATPRPPSTVASVDLQRYSGKWHEIARYPNWFQRGCAGGVTAEYTPRTDGSLRVVNSCRKADGTRERIEGRATVVPGSGHAWLKVRFFGPFAGDYWILALDPDYRWALVGHPSRKYLWILARDPDIPSGVYDRIVRYAVSQGYDAGKIRRTPK